MMWIKRAPFLMLICLMAVKFSGCALERLGGMSQVTCPVGQINVSWFDPFFHMYQLSGACTIEGEDVNYYVAAQWKKNENNLFEALAIVNTGGKEYKAIVRANCLNGDPLLYGRDGCGGPSLEDKYGNIPAEFRSVFESNPCPFLLTPEWKAALIAQDRWPVDAPPILWVPSQGLPPNFRYEKTPPENVIILYELPFVAAKDYNWKLFFTYQKWDPDTNTWAFESEVPVPVQLSSGKYYARKNLSLERGKYRFNRTWYEYKKSQNIWTSNTFEMPVEFHVGALKRASDFRIPKEFALDQNGSGQLEHIKPQGMNAGGEERLIDGLSIEKMPVSAPRIFLVGRKYYLPKEEAIFMIQGEPKGKPVLDFSPDGIQWNSKAPRGTKLEYTGSGAQRRCILQADTPGWYRVRFADILISEPIKVSKEMALAHQAEAKSMKKVDPNLKPGVQKTTGVATKTRGSEIVDGEQELPSPFGNLPDLRVDLELEAKEVPQSNGTMCYYIAPKYVISNRGKMPARSFYILVEYDSSGKQGNWQTYSEFGVRGLPPGKTIKYDANSGYPTCSSTFSPGWRIKVDSKKEVTESYEGNNTAFKYGSAKQILGLDAQKTMGAATKTEASGISPAPALFLSGKKSYSPKENVMFTLQGEPKGEPVIECSQDGLRWGTNCPKGISVRKIGTGVQARYMVAASEPGRYRLKLGNLTSETFEVKAAAGLSAKTPVLGQTGPAMPATALPAKVKTPSAGPVSSVKTPALTAPEAKIAPSGAPIIRLNAANLTAPARVQMAVQADPRFTAKYVLEKNENGVFREIASSDRPEFDIAEPGNYQVKAQYLNGNFGAPLAFTVKPKMEKAPSITKPQTVKTPAKVKKMQ